MAKTPHPPPPAFGLINEGAIGQPRLTTSLCDPLYPRKEKLDLANTHTCVASTASRMLRDKLVKVFEATLNFSFLN